MLKSVQSCFVLHPASSVDGPPSNRIEHMYLCYQYVHIKYKATVTYFQVAVVVWWVEWSGGASVWLVDGSRVDGWWCGGWM